MNHRSAHVIVLSAVAGLVAACGVSSRGLSEPAQTTPATHSSRSVCDSAALRLGYGSPPSMETGEHAVLYTLLDESSRSCVLVGYPAIMLFDATGAVLPFHYIDGRGQYVTNAPPTPVMLPPGTRAYFFIAKYRCDIGDLAAAATIRIALPPGGTAITGPFWAGGSGVSTLSYCRGGANDPGQFIGISPFEPTSQAATAWPSG